MMIDTIQETTRTLPKGWRWVRLGDIIADAQPGFASGERDSNGVIQIRMNNLDTRGNLLWDSFIRVPSDKATIAKYRLLPGDVLFNNTNSTELVGKSALFRGHEEPIVFSNHFTRLRCVADRLHPSYLALWLVGQWQSRVFSQLCNKWIGQSAVKNDKLLALEIPLPSLSEQHRIAVLLDEQLAAVERARAATEARLEAARALPAALLRQVFESEEAQGWPTKALGDVSAIGSGITLGRSFDGIQTRRVPYLRVANVKDGYLDVSDVYEINVPERDIEKCRLQYGDLLLTEGGDPDKLGRGTFWEEQIPECIHQNHIFRVRFDLERFSPAFLAAQIGSEYGKAYFLAHAKQTTGIATINQRVLAGFPLMIPPLAVQQHVANRINEQRMTAEQAIDSIRTQLDAINALPASLLRRAFAGEV